MCSNLPLFPLRSLQNLSYLISGRVNGNGGVFADTDKKSFEGL